MNGTTRADANLMRSDERDVRELIRPLRRRWWLIVAIAVAVGAGTYQHYRNQASTFSASTSVFVGGSPLDGLLLGTGGSGSGNDRTLQNQARLLRTRSVAQRVAKELGFRGDPQALLGQVTAAPVEDSDFVVISATAATPQAAVAIANGFAQAFVSLRSQDLRDEAVKARRDLERQMAALGNSTSDRRLSRTLNERLQSLRLIEAVPVGQATQVDRARAAQEVAARPRRNAIFGGILGVILGCLVVSGLHMLDRRLRGSEVEDDYQAPLLAVLPEDGRAIDRSKAQAILAGPLVEPVRMLRTTLSVATQNGSGPPRTILVTSAVPQEGKSTLVRSLALAYYEAGLRILVIDADLRRPTLAAALGLKPEFGLADVLLDHVTLQDAVVQAELETDTVPGPLQGDQRMLGATNGAADPFGASATPFGAPHVQERTSRGPQVAVLGSGKRVSDPAALFGTRRMATLLAEASSSYDMVLIDTAPLLAVSDAIPLLNQVDGILLVTRFNHTTRDDAKRARVLISRVPQIRVLGVVANGATSDDAPHPYAYAGAAP
jgi:succinoglycan biosynthesis transport protein ExoP